MSSPRRFEVPFDPEYFTRLAAAEGPRPLPAVFRQILETNHWTAPSASGLGSNPEQTAGLRLALPDLCRRFGIRTILDLPCGDGAWMAGVEWPAGTRYLGADVLPELVAGCQARYETPERRYLTLDVTESVLPEADLLFCRDCLVHLSFADIRKALARIQAGRITYLMTTTFPTEPANVDIATGDWRPLNFERAPFGFPPPIEAVLEACTEHDGIFADKSMGLWRVANLPAIAAPSAVDSMPSSSIC